MKESSRSRHHTKPKRARSKQTAQRILEAKGMGQTQHYKETNGKLWPFLKLYKELIKKRRMSIEQVVNVVDIAIDKLPYMETLYIQAKDQAEKMQRTIQRLSNDVAALERKISLLDKIAFSSDQECKKNRTTTTRTY